MNKAVEIVASDSTLRTTIRQYIEVGRILEWSDHTTLEIIVRIVMEELNR